MGRILTTGDIRRLTGWSPQKIRSLCESGKLPAVNTSTGKRPKWSIREEDFHEFLTPESKREPKPKPAAAKRQRLDANVAKVL